MTRDTIRCRRVKTFAPREERWIAVLSWRDKNFIHFLQRRTDTSSSCKKYESSIRFQMSCKYSNAWRINLPSAGEGRKDKNQHTDRFMKPEGFWYPHNLCDNGKHKVHYFLDGFCNYMWSLEASPEQIINWALWLWKASALTMSGRRFPSETGVRV